MTPRKQIINQITTLLVQLVAMEDDASVSPPTTLPAIDPRQPTARAHTKDADGKITGVQLNVHVMPNARYRCTNVYVIPEAQDGGQTIARVTVRQAGSVRVIDSHPNVFLATGYSGSPDHFDNFLTSGNDRNEFVIVNKFWPPNLGPLAILIRNDDGSIASDVVGSLGLPEGHHVSFGIEFEEQ